VSASCPFDIVTADEDDASFSVELEGGMIGLRAATKL